MSGIVVGIDGSRHASRALRWAMAEAALRKTDLTVLTVNPVPAGCWTGAPVTLAGDEQRVSEMRKLAEEEAGKAAEELGEYKPRSVVVQAMSGFPVRALTEASEQADLLVIGSRGSGIGALLLGSVADQVAHHARCPVVIVPAARESANHGADVTAGKRDK